MTIDTPRLLWADCVAEIYHVTAEREVLVALRYRWNTGAISICVLVPDLYETRVNLVNRSRGPESA